LNVVINVVITELFKLDTVIHESLLYIIIVRYKSMICDQYIINYKFDVRNCIL